MLWGDDRVNTMGLLSDEVWLIGLDSSDKVPINRIGELLDFSRHLLDVTFWKWVSPKLVASLTRLMP